MPVVPRHLDLCGCLRTDGNNAEVTARAATRAFEHETLRASNRSERSVVNYPQFASDSIQGDACSYTRESIDVDDAGLAEFGLLLLAVKDDSLAAMRQPPVHSLPQNVALTFLHHGFVSPAAPVASACCRLDIGNATRHLPLFCRGNCLGKLDRRRIPPVVHSFGQFRVVLDVLNRDTHEKALERAMV
jgi:hypothetical protein